MPLGSCEVEEVLEWLNPVDGIVTSSCGNRLNPIKKKQEFHDGLDIAAPEGTPAAAVANGVVTLTKNSKTFGLMLQYQTDDGYLITYGHLKEILVKEGERVAAGQTIAKTGNTGLSTGPHLHYGISRNGNVLDPMQFADLPYTSEVAAEYQARGESIVEGFKAY